MSRRKFVVIAMLLTVYALGCVALALLLPAMRPATSDPGQLSGQTRLPDMLAISDIPTRKQIFIDTLLPLILQKNHLLQTQRRQLLQWQQQVEAGKPLSHRQTTQLKRLQTRYNIDRDQSLPKRIEALLKRVDGLPPSLVLAQAAIESGWGTSRFAREGNNVFGLWCFQKGCGLVPKRRAGGARHEVRRFDALEAAVEAYYRNLNSHKAYTELRSARYRQRQQGAQAGGPQLALYLHRYSSRGQAYVKEIQTLIRYNRLEKYDIAEPPAAPNPI